jgi:hypothetical protein
VRVAETKLDAAATPSPGVAVRSSRQKHVLTFLMVFGPGLIVMEADNDAGAVSTYMQAGGEYGLHLLWTLIVLLPICYFVQEMVARLGIATGILRAAMPRPWLLSATDQGSATTLCSRVAHLCRDMQCSRRSSQRGGVKDRRSEALGFRASPYRLLL